jgi:hypothetical protein
MAPTRRLGGQIVGGAAEAPLEAANELLAGRSDVHGMVAGAPLRRRHDPVCQSTEPMTELVDARRDTAQ